MSLSPAIPPSESTDETKNFATRMGPPKELKPSTNGSIGFMPSSSILSGLTPIRGFKTASTLGIPYGATGRNLPSSTTRKGLATVTVTLSVSISALIASMVKELSRSRCLTMGIFKARTSFPEPSFPII